MHHIQAFEKIKEKEKVLKKIHEKKETLYTYVQCFSSKTIQARRQQGDIFKVEKKQKNHPNILFTGNISVKNKEEIKTFYDK